MPQYNSSIKRFRTSLTEAANFLEAPPKRQWYFEHFIEFYKKQIGVTKSEVKYLKMKDYKKHDE